MANVNAYNFLRWDEDPSLPDLSQLPNFFIQDKCVYPYMPVLVPGETLSFYINTKYGLDFPDPETLKLKIFKEGTESEAVDLEIDYLDVNDEFYNLYQTFEIPVLSDGIYRLKIVNTSGDILLLSNLVRVMNKGYETSTSYIRFRNATNHFGVRYGLLPDFFQAFRLHITEVTPDYEDNIETYTSATTGRVRNLTSNPQKFHAMQTYFFDKDAHEAAAVMVNSSFVEINNLQYALKSAYKPDAINSQGKSKGAFELYNLEFATINKCG